MLFTNTAQITNLINATKACGWEIRATYLQITQPQNLDILRNALLHTGGGPAPVSIVIVADSTAANNQPVFYSETRELYDQYGNRIGDLEYYVIPRADVIGWSIGGPQYGVVQTVAAAAFPPNQLVDIEGRVATRLPPALGAPGIRYQLS